MNEHLASNVQFCDEYEELFQNCLVALTRWNELRSFSQHADATGTRAGNELRQAQQRYSATFLELRAHARKCIVCEEMLRTRMNGGEDVTAYRVI